MHDDLLLQKSAILYHDMPEEQACLNPSVSDLQQVVVARHYKVLTCCRPFSHNFAGA